MRAWTRENSWTRSKLLSDEKWPRYCAEIPPELAVEIDAAQRKSLGVNLSAASRASVVRAGLRMYLEATDPEREAAIESTAIEVAGEIAPATTSLERWDARRRGLVRQRRDQMSSYYVKATFGNGGVLAGPVETNSALEAAAAFLDGAERRRRIDLDDKEVGVTITVEPRP